MNKTKLAALCLAVALFTTILPGIARAEKITLTFDLNFGGTTLHRNTWNRLEVYVANNSSDDLQGSVVVGVNGDYAQDVFVQAGKAATLVFYLPPTELAEGWSSRGTLFMNITVRNHRGREVASSRLNTSGHNPESKYIGVLGRTPGNFGRLANVLEDARVVGASSGHLDNILFAQNFGVIIISDPGIISLSPAQQQNLKTWVEAGGILVVGGGSGWRQTTALVPAGILPISPRTVETVTGADLTGLQLPVQPGEADYTVAVGEVHGKVLLHAGNRPLLVSKALGQGIVLWSALDLEAAPLENPANNEAFWNQVFLWLGPQSLSSPSTQHWAIGQVFNSLSQDSLASTLSPLKIFLLLIGYILLVGPVNWLILRKFDRREWAWFTIPALAIVFTMGAFTAGSLGRGTERVLYQVNMVDVHSNSMAQVRSYSGVFVPKRGDMILKSQAVGMVPLPGAVSTVEAGLSQLQFTNPPLWSIQRFYGADFIEIPGAFSVSVSVGGGQVGQRLQVEVTNNSGHGMFESYIRLGNRWYAVGELAQGETKSLEVTAQHNIDLNKILQRYSAINNPGRWYEIEQMLPQAPFAFVGFGDSGLLPVTGVAENVSLDLWVQILDSSVMAFGPGALEIPEGILTPILMGGGGRDARWHYGGEYNFEGQGSFDLVYAMPEGADYSQGEYSLNFRNFWGNAQGTVEIYNYNSGQWQKVLELDSVLKTQNSSVLLDNPGDMVRDNRLTVKVSFDGGHLGFHLRSLDITVKGGRVND